MRTPSSSRTRQGGTCPTTCWFPKISHSAPAAEIARTQSRLKHRQFMRKNWHSNRDHRRLMLLRMAKSARPTHRKWANEFGSMRAGIRRSSARFVLAISTAQVGINAPRRNAFQTNYRNFTTATPLTMICHHRCEPKRRKAAGRVYLATYNATGGQNNGKKSTHPT